ncbi:hypothetical protein INQ23_28385, partial [Escherichia coli]|nr:hypothetical protein [Escherichia coli]
MDRVQSRDERIIAITANRDAGILRKGEFQPGIAPKQHGLAENALVANRPGDHEHRQEQNRHRHAPGKDAQR